MKFFIPLFLVAFSWEALCADAIYFPSEVRRDSLLQVMGSLEGVELVDALNQLALYYNIAEPPKAAECINRAKETARKHNYLKGLAFALKEEGMMMLNAGDIIQALTLLDESKKLSLELNDNHLTGRAVHCMGIVYSVFGFYDFSQKYLNEAVNYYQRAGDHQLVAYCFYDQAGVYVKSKEFGKALEKVRECDKFSLDYHLAIEGGASHILLGNIYAGLGQDTLALENYKLGLVALEKEGSPDQLDASGLRALGQFYMQRGRYEEAKTSFRQAKNIIDARTNELEKAEVLLEIATVSLKQRFLKTALTTIDSALWKSQQTKSTTLLPNILFTKAEILKEMGLEGRALRDISKAYSIQDSIHSAGYETYIATMVAAFEAQKAELEIVGLNTELENTQGELKSTSTLSRLYLGAAIFFVALLIIIAFNLDKLRQVTKKLHAVNIQVNEQNKELKKLDSEKSDLIQLVAHDMRSPVNNIVSIADLLRQEDLKRESHQEYVDLIKTICEKINNSISKFLGTNVADISASQTPEPSVVDITSLVDEIAREYHPKAGSKNIELTCTLPSEKVLVTTDGDYLEQIVSNLLSNALKFCPPGSKAKLELKLEATTLSIIVEDDGPGIALAEQKGLFQRYVTTSNKPTDNEQSTGLGLAISKQLAEAIGGDISLHSEPGRGSKFVVILPLSREMANTEAS